MDKHTFDVAIKKDIFSFIPASYLHIFITNYMELSTTREATGC
jgi:hypothetical protein